MSLPLGTRLCLPVLAMVALLASAVPSVSAAGDKPVCASLQWEPDHLPWLTLPGSRLVLNPNFGVTAPLPPPSVPNLPVSLAYHVGERPVAL
ncbi:MAG TPA: hypothetical protein VGN26_19125, partial [Armatimonadota bacterium]